MVVVSVENNLSNVKENNSLIVVQSLSPNTSASELELIIL